MSWYDEFVEKNKPQTYSQDFRGDVCQVMAQAGYVSFHPFAFFPVAGGQFEEMAAQQCREFIVQNGGEAEPRAVIRLTRFVPLINKENQPNWRDGQNDTQMTIGYSNDPDWVKFSSQFKDDGILPNDKFGQKFWAHVLNHPYPSFVEDDESTHKKWNSWTNSEGKTMPNFMPIVQRLFVSEEEARAWYKDQVVDVGTVAGNEGVTWDEAIAKQFPMPPVGWSVTDGKWGAMKPELWHDVAKQFVAELVNKDLDPQVLASQYGGPITVELATQLKELGLKHNPF